MMKSETALITGASGGIGYEFAKLLARECGTLVLVARNEARLREVKRELEAGFPATVKTIVRDLADVTTADEIFKELEAEKIVVDILINNAGFGSHGAFADTDWSGESSMIGVNIASLTRMTKLFIKGMIERGKGKILNVASTAAFQPGPFMAVYYASKAYVLSFSEAIANEVRGSGVTVTALCPGPTATGFATTAGVGRSRLFTFVRPAAPGAVARYGYEAMVKGRTVAVPGLLNKIGVFSGRFAPRNLLTAIIRGLHGPARCDPRTEACAKRL